MKERKIEKKPIDKYYAIKRSVSIRLAMLKLHQVCSVQALWYNSETLSKTRGGVLTSFIHQLELLVKQASHLQMSDSNEIDAAARVLGHSPVVGYEAFRYEEVKLLAVYRRFESTGSWNSAALGANS